MKIVVASANPVKIKATKIGFSKMFLKRKINVEGANVGSGVSDQPVGDEEIFIGALNRAKNAKRMNKSADYWVGIEGGVEHMSQGTEAFAWVIVLSKNGKVGKGRTGSFFLPKKVVKLINEGKELGEADDIVFGLKNSKQANGAVGILTGDVLTRTTFYVPAVILALIPFKNPKLY